MTVSSKKVDAIVVGGGIGGLTAGALLAKAGQKVVLIEQHGVLGGYAQAFTRQGIGLDACVHMVGGCEKTPDPRGGLIHRVLDTLGVADLCRFIPLDPVYSLWIDGETISVPAGGVDACIEVLASRFPKERKGIGTIMKRAAKLYDMVRDYPLYPSLRTHLITPFRFPTLVLHGKRTLQEMLDRTIRDKTCQAAVAGLWPYLGTPSNRLSFVLWSVLMTCYLKEGGYYCESTFQRLAGALTAGIEAHGGQVMTSARVKRIEVDNGKVKGVALEEGEVLEAKTVISNADLTKTTSDLVGEPNLPGGHVERIAAMTPSVSALVVYGITDLDIACRLKSYETIVLETADLRVISSGFTTGEMKSFFISVPSLVGPTACPRGKHVVTLSALVAHALGETWADQKQTFANRLVKKAENIIPGLAESFEILAVASPATLGRYTSNTKGALVGWENTPAQVGTHRPGPRTPIQGLYIAGHWSRPSGGIYGVMASGCYAVQNILGYKTLVKLFKALC